MKNKTEKKRIILNNNKKEPEIQNEVELNMNKEKKNEENKQNIITRNKKMSQTFFNNIRKPSYKEKKNLNLNIKNNNNGVNVNIVLCVTKRDNKNINKKEEEKMPKLSPYDFKYFCNSANKKSFGRALSTNNSIRKTNQEVESNFINLSKDANIYTSNADYIKNKKLLLFDKYIFPNNKYKPNRANIFDMTSIPHSKIPYHTVYKTTKFRGGRMFFFDNKKSLSIQDDKSKNNKIFINKKPLYIQDLEKYELKTQNEFYKSNEKFKYVDNSYQNKKRHPPSNSLYKELMTKKNEIYDTFINNKMTKTEKSQSSIFNPIFPVSSSENDQEINKKNIKNEEFKELTGYSNLLSKKKNDGIIPITFPLICSNAAKCDTISQRKRFENIMETFVRLKSLIENDKKLGKNNEIDYIIEFILSKNIDRKYIEHQYINNFLNFLKNKKLPININKTLKENIILALNFDQSKKNNIIYINENDNDNKMIIEGKREIKKSNNILNPKPLEFDLKRQTQLFIDKNYKDHFELRDSLKKELDSIDYDVANKQTKINQIESDLNLLPFEENYYYKYKMEKKSKLKKKDNFEFILLSPQGYYKAIVPNKKQKNKIIKKDNLFDSNERLYYNWFKNKNGGEIQNYIKKSKLTEYIIYNRTKDKILKNKLKEIAEKTKIKEINKNNKNIEKV